MVYRIKKLNGLKQYKIEWNEWNDLLKYGVSSRVAFLQRKNTYHNHISMFTPNIMQLFRFFFNSINHMSTYKLLNKNIFIMTFGSNTWVKFNWQKYFNISGKITLSPQQKSQNNV